MMLEQVLIIRITGALLIHSSLWNYHGTSASERFNTGNSQMVEDPQYKENLANQLT